MNLLKALVVGIALLGASCAYAADATDSIASLRYFSETTKQMQAHFEQSTYDASGYLTDESTGVFFFNRPNQFRWVYETPIEELILGDGEFLWHYDPTLAQVMRQPQPNSAYSPLLVLSDYEMLMGLYDVTVGPSPSQIVLLPRELDAPIEQARVTLEGGQPVMVEWEDRFGQINRLIFSQIELNQPLNSALFEFEMPKGVDLVEGL